MSFDFFNTSYLAFGAKLTAAFNSIGQYVELANNNLNQVIKDQEIFQDYLGKNYRVPRPNKADAPCRTDELFDTMNDKRIYIRKLAVEGSNIVADIVIFNRTNNRITRCTGSTDLTTGYCFYTEATSNKKYQQELKFVDSANKVTGTQLFRFRKDKSGNVNILGSGAGIELVPHDLSRYNKMSIGKTLATNNADYTSDDYQCVCVIGWYVAGSTPNRLTVNLNGNWVCGNSSDFRFNRRHCILYLKPNDVVSGIYYKIFKIEYGQN